MDLWNLQHIPTGIRRPKLDESGPPAHAEFDPLLDGCWDIPEPIASQTAEVVADGVVVIVGRVRVPAVVDIPPRIAHRTVSVKPELVGAS